MPTTTTKKPAAAAASAAAANTTAHRSVQIQPYVFFDGRCDEAIAFYRRALGAEVVMLMRFKDAPPPPADSNNMCPPPTDIGEKVMHANLRVGSTEILMSDGMAKGQPKFDGFALSLTVAAPADAEKCFRALADGGQIHTPLGKTFFSPAFGMLADRFGVMWMVYVKP